MSTGRSATQLGLDLTGALEINYQALTISRGVVLGAAGPGGLSGALQFALAQDAPLCATVLIDALSSAGERTSGLNAALSSPYKSVRYAASFALAMNGHVDGAGGDGGPGVIQIHVNRASDWSTESSTSRL